MVTPRISQVIVDAKWPDSLLNKHRCGKKGERWYVNVQVITSDKYGKEVGDYYGLIVASPEFVKKPARKIAVSAQYVFVTDEFDLEEVKKQAESRVADIRVDSWEKLSDQMRRYFWVD